jgi:Co/Zn/Cd efflux system component
MNRNPATLAQRKKKALLINFFIIFSTWFPFVFISIMSNSITLIAQMLIGGAQSLSVYLSMQTTRNSLKHPENQLKNEIKDSRIVVVVFMLSFLVVMFIAIKRMFLPKQLEFYASMVGLAGNAVAIFVNGYQWHKNLKISREAFSPLMEGQWSLFRIKTFTALFAVLSVVSYYLLPQHFFLQHYIDPIFSLGLAVLILHSAIGLMRTSGMIGGAWTLGGQKN